MSRAAGLLAIAVVVVLGGSALSALPPARSAEGAFPAQTNNQGQVFVTVTPLALSPAADAWRFQVQFNTHVVAQTQDMMQVAVLSDGNGREERPLAWQGDPPGGHHRKGVLVFKPMVPAPQSVTLKIANVGAVPERAFTWKLAGAP